MKKDFLNIIIGSIAAILITGLLIYAVEKDKSFIQIIIGFTVFVIPFSFISSFKSKVMSFILVSCSIIFGYLAYKFGYKDFWIGILQALVVGGSIYLFKIRTTTTFSQKKYKEEAQRLKDLK